MKKLVIFNWKMAPDSLKEARTLAELTQARTNKTKTEIVIAAPFVYLPKLEIGNCLASPDLAKREKLKIGAQDVFWATEGAYTGEISPKMLKNLGVEYVIIGHSERRKYLGETDEMINKKVLATLKTGLKAILCVSKKAQLKKDLNKVITTKNLIVAYEPIWAIGTGNFCRPEDAAEMARAIKREFKVKVLYGGSIDSKNIKNFLQYKEIDGALVGGASLKKDEVKKICQTKI